MLHCGWAALAAALGTGARSAHARTHTHTPCTPRAHPVHTQLARLCRWVLDTGKPSPALHPGDPPQPQVPPRFGVQGRTAGSPVAAWGSPSGTSAGAGGSWDPSRLLVPKGVWRSGGGRRSGRVSPSGRSPPTKHHSIPLPQPSRPPGRPFKVLRSDPRGRTGTPTRPLSISPPPILHPRPSAPPARPRTPRHLSRLPLSQPSRYPPSPGNVGAGGVLPVTHRRDLAGAPSILSCGRVGVADAGMLGRGTSGRVGGCWGLLQQPLFPTFPRWDGCCPHGQQGRVLPGVLLA